MGVVIIISAILTLILIFFLYFHTSYKKRTNEYKDWEIDDEIIVDGYWMSHNGIKFSNGRELALVKGWSENSIYLNFGDNNVYKLGWEIFKQNKSAMWRRNFNECKKSMGKNPAFASGYKSATGSSSKDKVDGKNIELLTEVECEVYLKQAIQEENYELAEKIRKRMEKFR